MMMRAAVLRDGEVAVREIPVPVPGHGQILVKTCACGICASDLHFMQDPQVLNEHGGGLWNHVPGADMVMGHEFCAEVVDYGPKTTRKWKPGTRISSSPALITPAGIRITGYSPDAPGGYGQYFLVTEMMAQEVKSDLPSEILAAADAMAVGWYYAKAAALKPREVPLVIGCGAIGLSVVAALKALGVGPIVAVDFDASRRDIARTMGADVLIDPAAESPYAGWRQVAYGKPDAVASIFEALNLPACVAFECVGVGGVLGEIIQHCERGTRIFSAGGCPAGDHIHSVAAHIKGLNIQFGGGPMMPDWNEAFAAVCSGKLDPRPMIGEVIGLEQVPDAIRRAGTRGAPPRIVIAPNAN